MEVYRIVGTNTDASFYLGALEGTDYEQANILNHAYDAVVNAKLYVPEIDDLRVEYFFKGSREGKPIWLP